MLYLTTLSTHFIYGYMASVIITKAQQKSNIRFLMLLLLLFVRVCVFF